MLTVLAAIAAASIPAAYAANQGLYGMSSQIQLGKIDTTSGAFTGVGVPCPYEAQAQQLSSIDSKRGIYYIIGYELIAAKPNLVGIDLSTGKVVTNTTLPFAESAFIGVGQQIDIDPTTGTIFAGGRLVAKGPHTIGKVDPTSGQYTHIASINGTYLPVLGGASTFDSQSGQLMVQLGVADAIDNFVVDTKTGAVEQIPEDPETGRILTTLQYNPKDGLVYGLGIKPNGQGGIERTLATLDLKTKTYNTLCEVTDYLVESGGESALDYDAGVLTWIGQKAGAKPTDPFYLVSTDVKTCKTVSAPQLCTSDPTCPWSIEYRMN